VVLAVHAAPGQAVAAGLRVEPVVVLAPSGRLAARVLLARRPRLGAAATVRVAGRALAGRVESVSEAGGGGWEAQVVFAVPEDAGGGGAAVSVCVRCWVSGRVQGVFFRASTRERALALGLRGYARNLPDGRVEVLACGPEDAVAEGPPLARVDDVRCEPADPAGCPDGFDTR